MSKIIIFRIAVATFFIILSCLFSVNYQDMVGFSLILSVGLIHGANDLLIIKRNTSSDTNFSQSKSFIKYFGIVLAGLIFFYFFPSFASSFYYVNEVFYTTFFSILIIADVFILLLSFLYTERYSQIMRNTGFIICTILIRLSFSSTGLTNLLLIVSSVIFGLLILKIYSLMNRIE